MVQRASDKTTKTIILGEDLFTHERVANISTMIKAFKEFSGFNVILLSDIILNASDELEEVAELKSYNGTVAYKYTSSEDEFVYGSESFSRVAKVANKDVISINYGNQSIRRVFKLDKNLQGTIALCGVTNEDESFL